MSPKRTVTAKLSTTHHPLLYEVNTRVLLTELSLQRGKRITLQTIPEDVLETWLPFDAVWLMGVWTTGPAGREIATHHAVLREEYRRALPDVTDDDILGSPYSVAAYTVPEWMGGEKGLAALRERLAAHGVGLVLDFLCNHTARDHSWVHDHPEYYVQGEDGEETRDPASCFRVETVRGARTVMFGRDPMFPAWTDTAQMNHAHPQLRAVLIAELGRIADRCDGVRCDMAMLALSDVFQRTWGGRIRTVEGMGPEPEFWREAIRTVRKDLPSFLFVAEAYWDREWDLQQLGFDYTYDKRLYDRLLREGASSVYDHLRADLAYQARCVRFIENHDEPRAARVLNNDRWHCAAAVIMATVPGMALFHDGQCAGRQVKLPVQLSRRPPEEMVPAVRAFYDRLLACVAHPVFREGEWHLLPVRAAWHDNYSYQNCIAHWWHAGTHGDRFVMVNYAPYSAQCYVEVPVHDATGTASEFTDTMSNAMYVRDHQGLRTKGMYFDLPPYAFHIFDVKSVRK